MICAANSRPIQLFKHLNWTQTGLDALSVPHGSPRLQPGSPTASVEQMKTKAVTRQDEENNTTCQLVINVAKQNNRCSPQNRTSDSKQSHLEASLLKRLKIFTTLLQFWTPLARGESVDVRSSAQEPWREHFDFSS